jgi:hypothetical protein
MSVESSSFGRVSVRGGRREVRPIEFRRLIAAPVGSGYSQFVGRVGALAVALGVGAAVASMPMALADTTGSGGSTGSSDSSSSDSSSAPKSAAPSRGAARAGRGGSSVVDSVEDSSDASPTGRRGSAAPLRVRRVRPLRPQAAVVPRTGLRLRARQGLRRVNRGRVLWCRGSAMRRT